MARQNTRDPELIKRYLEGELLDEDALSPEERAQFAKLEEAFLEDTELLDELMMRQAFKGLERGGELERYAAVSNVADLSAHRTKRGIFRLLHSPQYAAAASIALVACLVLSSVLYIDNRGLRSSGAGIGGAPITAVLPLISVRGAGTVNELVRPGPGEVAVVTVDGGFDPYGEYRTRVVRLAGGTRVLVDEQRGLVLGQDGTVAIVLPGRLLEPGDYEIELGGRRRDWAPDRDFETVTSVPMTVVPLPAGD
jgi:hypothetical protein